MAVNLDRLKNEIDPEMAYTTKEVCKMLNVPISTLRRWADTGKISKRKMGGRVLVQGSELLKLIN